MLRVNPYCSNWGWLFEDLKATLGRTDVPGVSVTCSETPLPDADVWIAIRTGEALASPDPSRTIVQWHDYRSHAVWPTLTEYACLQCVHEGQVLTAPPARRVEVCRIGYRELFTRRGAMPERPTVGWVGRDVIWQHSRIKHPLTFTRLVNELQPMVSGWVRAMMYGPSEGPGNLTHYAKQAAAALTDGDRAESLRNWYHGIDLLISTTEPEPGPLPIYEALACGVPVLSTPTGAADYSKHAHVTPREDLARVARRMLRDRSHYFDHRHEVRESVEGLTQERWARFTLELAQVLAD